MPDSSPTASFPAASLSDTDREQHAWQLDVPGLGETGQARLKGCTALVSRVGGLGGPLAFGLAAAGFGKIILAHAGNLKSSDLNRQILMREGALGEPRAEQAAETLRRFKRCVTVEAVAENLSPENAASLVGRADIVFGAAPLFDERFLLNRECVWQGKPLIDAAMYALEGTLLTVLPGKTACLACLYPEAPPHWKRRFPVLGAVSALIANAAVIEGVKLVAGFGESHAGQLLHFDGNAMNLRKLTVARRKGCLVCGNG